MLGSSPPVARARCTGADDYYLATTRLLYLDVWSMDPLRTLTRESKVTVCALCSPARGVLGSDRLNLLTGGLHLCPLRVELESGGPEAKAARLG